MPSLSSDDAADIVPSLENTSWDDEYGCIGYARSLHRLYVLDRIGDAILEKKKHDAAVEREAARVRLKQQEESSRAAEADLRHRRQGGCDGGPPSGRAGRSL